MNENLYKCPQCAGEKFSSTETLESANRVYLTYDEYGEPCIVDHKEYFADPTHRVVTCDGCDRVVDELSDTDEPHPAADVLLELHHYLFPENYRGEWDEHPFWNPDDSECYEWRGADDFDEIALNISEGLRAVNHPLARFGGRS